ncbi:hypothetical protein B0I35DRAFT_275324 [Stachybotrys elegans]|uniref:Uncharacterized protein n=1 Tax=Stachybotrys elegans TaxID=80388 RepID=A0A8K0ST89_9HYPO|nr:hypothetical protein B0I35DRAFT_275324 [Stachybotrys elegans]
MRDQLTSTFKKPLWNDQDKSAKTEQPRASKLLAPESSVALGEVGYVPAFSPTSSIVQEQRQVPDRQQPPLAHPPKQPTVGDGENESIIATRALSSNAAVLSISHDEAQLITRIHDNISTIPRTPPVPGRVLKCRFAVNGREIRDYDFTPDNRHLVMAHASYSALYMAGITVHDAHYGYWVRQIATNGRQFHHMALSDKFAAFASMMGGLDIWSLPGWHRVGGLGGQILVALAWWDDEKILMSAASDIIKIWGTGSLETDGSLTELCALQRPSEWSTIQHAAISHRGLVGALCKSEIRLWAPDASNREWLFLATVWSEAPYHDFCFARRGGRIICCTETYVEMVRITDSSVVWRTYMSSIAMGVAASMNGKHLAVSCEDRVAILDWTGRIVVDLAGPGLKSENRKAKFCGKDQLVASLVSNEQVAVWKY